MKQCLKCGRLMRDTNPYALYCSDCHKKMQKGPYPPKQEPRLIIQ